MRFADLCWRSFGIAALALAIGGCASIREPFEALKQAITPAPAPAQAAASAPAAAASAPIGLPPPVVVTLPARSEPDTPITPAVQRSFDDARKALRAGRTDEAERGFRALAKEHPELGGAHANLGLIYRHANKLPESVAELELAVRASPSQALYYNQLGISYRESGQFQKAREAYEKAIDLDASYASPILNLGILHDLYLWDGPRALELYDRYLALSPGGDAQVSKWVADLKNRKPQPITVSRKEQP